MDGRAAEPCPAGWGSFSAQGNNAQIGMRPGRTARCAGKARRFWQRSLRLLQGSGTSCPRTQALQRPMPPHSSHWQGVDMTVVFAAAPVLPLSSYEQARSLKQTTM